MQPPREPLQSSDFKRTSQPGGGSVRMCRTWDGSCVCAAPFQGLMLMQCCLIEVNFSQILQNCNSMRISDDMRSYSLQKMKSSNVGFSTVLQLLMERNAYIY